MINIYYCGVQLQAWWQLNLEILHHKITIFFLIKSLWKQNKGKISLILYEISSFQQPKLRKERFLTGDDSDRPRFYWI